MGYKRVCDLCGHELCETGREFKIKAFNIKERWYAWPSDTGWEKIECHEACLRALIDASRRRKEHDMQAFSLPYLIDRDRLLEDLNSTLAYQPEIDALIMAQPRRTFGESGTD